MYLYKIKVDEGVETALAVTDDLFLIEGMEVSKSLFLVVVV